MAVTRYARTPQRAVASGAVTFYELVLALHIAAVVVAFGPLFAYAVGLRAARAGGPAGLAAFHRGQRVLVRYATFAMVVVLGAGLYLALDRYSLGDPWISAGLGILIVLFGVYGAYLGPTERRAAELAAGAHDATDGQYALVAKRLVNVTALAALLVAAAIVIMTVKPGA